MALKQQYTIGVLNRTRLLNSNLLEPTSSDWSFKYITRNADGTDAADYPNKPLQEKEKYPAETIFLDSAQDIFSLESSVGDIFIDRTPITVVSSNIQYVTIAKDRYCEITFHSNTSIDVKNIIISCGNPAETESDDFPDGSYPFFSANRKSDDIIINDISDIYVIKNNNDYTVSFYLSKDFSPALLSKYQLYVTVWNISGTSYTFSTPKNTEWKYIAADYNVSTLNPLKITFTEITPENMIVTNTESAYVKVIIQNPNLDFLMLEPHVELNSTSIGQIDKKTYSFDPKTGTLSFTIVNINRKGFIHVDSWLTTGNDEIDTELKAATRIDSYDSGAGILGEWCVCVGRLIKFEQNVPKYLDHDNYKSFVTMTQDFMNTIYSSLSNDVNISCLEKIARISDFNNIKQLETALLDQYKKDYNISINPNLEKYKDFLETKSVTIETSETDTVNDGISLLSISDDVPLDNKVLEKTYENFIFQNLTGEELSSFIKDVYKNLPYYNQMSGTYRGIKFILEQLGLCIKLVEIWSNREKLISNFNHEITEYREDEIAATRTNEKHNIVASIGNLYLTSRFDVDILESQLSFEKFNELSYSIVNLILSVKPLHRVLRKLSYIFDATIGTHFQYFLLEDLGDANIPIKRFNYTWDLFDKYSVKKSNIISDTMLSANSLFVPFNAVNAEVMPLSICYNDYGEIIESTVTEDDFIPASKNTYNNLNNLEFKIKNSKLKNLIVKFGYLSIMNDGLYYNGALLLDGVTKSSADKNFIYNDNEYNVYSFMNNDYDDLPFSEELKSYRFSINNTLSIKSETNGFNLILGNTVKSILNEMHIPLSYNKATDDETPLCLLIKIENIGIPLGTNYIMQINN